VATDRRNGQAFVELIIGIVVIVMIVAGGIQYFYASNAHRKLTTTLRGEVGERAMSGIPYISTPSYILTWDEGDDGIRHTDDDTPRTASPAALTTIAGRSVNDTDDWDLLEPLSRDNPMLSLSASPAPTAELGLIDIERSDTIAVDPAVRALIFDRPSITVRHSVWMPLLGGLY
jgi:hypothetical protein